MLCAQPLGSAPLAAQGGAYVAPTVYATVAEALVLTSLFQTLQPVKVQEALAIAHTQTLSTPITAITEAMIFAGTSPVVAKRLAIVAEALGFTDVPYILLNASITESLVLTGTLTGIKATTIMAIVESLVLRGYTTLGSVTRVAEALAFHETMLRVFAGTITEAAAFIGTINALSILKQTVVGSLVFSDTALGLAHYSVQIADNFAFTDATTPKATLMAAIRDGLAFSVGFVFDNTPYVGLALNAATTGVSTYTNYPFNSMTVFNRQVYGATTAGLYREGATKDAGVDIIWRIRTGLTNLDTGRAKGLDAAYIGYTATGRIILKCIVVNGAGDKIGYQYELTSQGAGNPRPGRIMVGRGLRSVYWAFELTNLTTGTIELDTLELHPIILEGRLP